MIVDACWSGRFGGAILTLLAGDRTSIGAFRSIDTYFPISARHFPMYLIVDGGVERHSGTLIVYVNALSTKGIVWSRATLDIRECTVNYRWYAVCITLIQMNEQWTDSLVH